MRPVGDLQRHRDNPDQHPKTRRDDNGQRLSTARATPPDLASPRRERCGQHATVHRRTPPRTPPLLSQSSGQPLP